MGGPWLAENAEIAAQYLWVQTCPRQPLTSAFTTGLSNRRTAPLLTGVYASKCKAHPRVLELGEALGLDAAGQSCGGQTWARHSKTDSGRPKHENQTSRLVKEGVRSRCLRYDGEEAVSQTGSHTDGIKTI